MIIAAIVLAAGGSTRLGSPKQLLLYRGKSLLRRAAESALAAACHPVLVVLGSGAERLTNEIDGLDVQLVVNPCWDRGMGTSIRLGIDQLDVSRPDTDAALLTVCDQPLVGPESLGRILDTYRHHGLRRSIVAASYVAAVGVPALFGRAYFEELRALPDRGGAKPILQRHRASVIEVPVPEAATDIDTAEQYDRLVHAVDP